MKIPKLNDDLLKQLEDSSKFIGDLQKQAISGMGVEKMSLIINNGKVESVNVTFSNIVDAQVWCLKRGMPFDHFKKSCNNGWLIIVGGKLVLDARGFEADLKSVKRTGFKIFQVAVLDNSKQSTRIKDHPGFISFSEPDTRYLAGKNVPIRYALIRHTNKATLKREVRALMGDTFWSSINYPEWIYDEKDFPQGNL
jgi:hypothetical protein